MAIKDIEAFVRQRALEYDPTLNVNPGSPFDVQLVQPLVRRLGTDPFTVDLATFIANRMQQAFPDIANQEEDAVTDLLNKPATLLWDPIVREITRVRQSLSFQDPTSMTLEEADALGANFFLQRRRGSLSKGVGRIFFSAPQNVSITPANFFSSKSGLHFYPTNIQSIRTAEMILNQDSTGTYYFDVNLIAEASGTQYDIGPGELIRIANLGSAVRVTNTRKFREGAEEENAQQFISRAQQSLSERSLVTLRGVAAKLIDSFPEINRLNVIGFNDPEMQRDIVRGGGLGAIIACGSKGKAASDGRGNANQSYFTTSEADFVALLGSTSPTSSFVLTVFGAFGPTVPVRDLNVVRAVNTTTLEVSEQALALGTGDLPWTLRKQELTLSDIPGGILFPNTPNGDVQINSGEIHIGGMYDTYIRGSSFDDEVFTISNVTDDAPSLSGSTATAVVVSGNTLIQLNSLVLGTSFLAGDATAQILDAAIRDGYTLQLLDAPNVGVYRVLSWSTVTAGPDAGKVQLAVTPTPLLPTTLNSRWKLFDSIDIDLLNPRETRIQGTDLSVLQNSNEVNVATGTDFNALGVSQGDTLEILGGPLAGKYTITAPPLTPTSLQVDRVFKTTSSGNSYTVYRANGEALITPFVRVTKVELLDSSNQPIGTTIPYARPVDIQTRAFQNPARGVKVDLVDAELGIVSQPGPFVIGAPQLSITFMIAGTPTTAVVTLTTTGTVPVATVISELDSELTLLGFPGVVLPLGNDRFGIQPFGSSGVVAVSPGGAYTALFGTSLALRTTGDITSSSVTSWGSNLDLVEGYDVLQVLDGEDIGVYQAPFSTLAGALYVGDAVSGLTVDTTKITKVFAPAVSRRVQFGARSIGSARVFFLEPTSFEVGKDTVFTLETTDRGTMQFAPDPTLRHQKLPSLPSNKPIQDGVVSNGNSTLTSASQDFLLSGIQPGDILEIDTIVVESDYVLPDPVPLLAGKTLVVALKGEPDRIVIFLTDSASLNPANGEVSRNGVIAQINGAVGQDIVELTADYRIRFKTADPLVVRNKNTSTCLVTAPGYTPILGNVVNTTPPVIFADEDVTNESPDAGEYVIEKVEQTVLTVVGNIPAVFSYPPNIGEQSFRVYRAGIQRISATAMAKNVAEAGLYYFDVELLSLGTGDVFNIGEREVLTVEGYKSDGYYLTTDDPILSFSELERPRMVVSRSILEQGVDDDPSNATQITGENIEISYQRTQLVSDVQGYLSSETERVICANPLSRHLIPYFVRLDVKYTGGAREDVVISSLERYINDLAPVDTLDASDVQKLVTDQGANYVRNPLELVAVVHDVDRTIRVERSQDRLAVDDRLSTFIPDQLLVERKLT